MNKKINCLQASSMLVMVTMSSFMGVSVFSIIKIAGVDSYLSPILGGIIGLLILLLFLYIANYQPDLPVNKKIEHALGKKIGVIVNILLAGLVFLMGISGMFNLTNFIVSQFLPETPLFLVGILFVILIVFINLKGIETMSRVGLLLLIINLALFLLFIVGLFPQIDLANLKPFLEFGMTKPLQGALYVVMLNVSPMFMLLMIPKNSTVTPQKYNKYMVIAYCLSFILAFSVMFLTIGNLGVDLANIYQYPEYMVMKRINFFNFLDRIENIITIQWIFGLFFSLSLCTYFVSNTIKYQNKSKILTIVIALGFLVAATFLFKNNTVFNNYSFKLSGIFRSLIPLLFLIVGIVAFFKHKHKKIK